MDIRLPHNWRPRPCQDNLWKYLSDGGLRAVACWHRRVGKDDVSLNHTACAAHERVGNYVHMLPEYSQARKAIWDAVNPHTGVRRIDQAFPSELRETTREQEMLIKFKNGSTWQVAGSDAYDSMMGTSFAGIVMSEYALANPSAWGYFSPILRENNGWAIFISTPRGHNHFEKICQHAERADNWFFEKLTVEDTGLLTPEELADELAVMQVLYGDDYGRALFQQEYYVSFDAAVPGAIWADCILKAEQEGRIADFDSDPALLVDTGWDLGRTDDTAIWFRQIYGTTIDVIDHHSSNFKDIPFYVDLLLERRARHGWRYGTHWLPHDARPRTLAAGGKSILQQFLDASAEHPELGTFAIAPRLDRQEGIQAARATFPYCRFHKTRCESGLNSLKHYHRKWDDELKKFSDHPEHNWASHDSDAWRTLSLTWKVTKLPRGQKRIEDRLRESSIERLTFGQLKAQHLAKMRSKRAAESYT